MKKIVTTVLWAALSSVLQKVVPAMHQINFE
jgi:hypothetical protein